MNILEQLFNGDLDPAHNIEPHDIEYWKKDKLVDEMLNQWAETLGKEFVDFYWDMMVVCLHMARFEKQEAFGYGFSLAVSIMEEAHCVRLHTEKKS